MKQVYLLTGRPGTGKTSLIKQAVAGMRGKAGGFYTEEIRGQGVRLGFKLITLNGKSAILAHVGIHSPYRVSKYGVDTDGLERVGVSALYKAAEECDLVIIDESHKIKNASTNRYKDLMEINEFRAAAKTILTGTPITNTIFDLWAQFEWMGKGLSGFSTFANFRSFHGKWEQGPTNQGADNGIRKLIGFYYYNSIIEYSN